MSALSCILLFFLGRRVFNEWVGIAAALVFAFYPSAIHFGAQKIGYASLYVTLILLFILQLIDLANAPSIKKSILAGLNFGMALLTFPAILSFLPFALGWLLLRGGHELRTRAINVCFVILVAIATVSPWQIRNYCVFDRFIPIKSNFAREIYWGNFADKQSTEERRYLDSIDEGKKSAFYWKKAFNLILTNSTELAARSATKFKLYWTAMPRAGRNYWEPRTGDIKERVAEVSYLLILALGIAGVCLTLLKGRDVQLLVIAILTLPIPFYLTIFTRLRYRFPVEPILMLFACYTVYRLGKLKNTIMVSLFNDGPRDGFSA
jgi:4-amino-4-deoxy-L-arabinose transferase-like glycosyltransferase